MSSIACSPRPATPRRAPTKPHRRTPLTPRLGPSPATDGAQELARARAIMLAGARVLDLPWTQVGARDRHFARRPRRMAKAGVLLAAELSELASYSSWRCPALQAPPGRLLGALWASYRPFRKRRQP